APGRRGRRGADSKGAACAHSLRSGAVVVAVTAVLALPVAVPIPVVGVVTVRVAVPLALSLAVRLRRSRRLVGGRRGRLGHRGGAGRRWSLLRLVVSVW